MTTRRGIILSAALGAIVPSLVRADSLIDIPGDPVTAAGLRAATKWSVDHFAAKPGCRLVYSDGDATGWFRYEHLSRPILGSPERKYPVAIEVRVPDASGGTFVTSIPLDDGTIRRIEKDRVERIRSENERFQHVQASLLVAD